VEEVLAALEELLNEEGLKSVREAEEEYRRGDYIVVESIPDEVKSRVLEAINSILANPFSRVKLRGELEGYWR
jgi:ketol-acid reductoisomerase